MNALARQAIRIYPRTGYTDRKAVNTLRRGWIRQIEYLGDKWLLAKPIPRRQSGFATVDQMVFCVCCIGGIAAMVLL